MVLHTNSLWIFLKLLILYNILTSQHITVVIYLIICITRKGISGVSNLYVPDFIGDHRALHVSLTCSRAHPERKQIEVRSLKRIQCDVLEADLIGMNIDR